MKKALKITWRIICVLLGVIIAAVVIMCGYILVRRLAYGDDLPSVFGYSAATVLTGSMEPTFYEGDVVIIKACDSYEEGDIITFYDEDIGGYTTHRIVGEKDGLYITQGDANNITDTSGVAYSQVAGKVVFIISGAGGVISFLQTPAGIICIIAALVALWLVFELCAFVVKKLKKE